jgi:hypothetical protein
LSLLIFGEDGDIGELQHSPVSPYHSYNPKTANGLQAGLLAVSVQYQIVTAQDLTVQQLLAVLYVHAHAHTAQALTQQGRYLYHSSTGLQLLHAALHLLCSNTLCCFGHYGIQRQVLHHCLFHKQGTVK